MTQYLNKSFSVGVGGKKYAEGWERIFGVNHEGLGSTEHSQQGASPEQTGSEDRSGPNGSLGGTGRRFRQTVCSDCGTKHDSCFGY